MAKLTTTYDATLKEKIFVLKGEEAYARSTDCILEEVLHNGERRADWNTDIKKMKLEFHIDVLRDIGASYVTLYDNDDVIAVYDFDTNTHAIDLIYDEDTGIDNRIELAYDVEHHIYAKYMGNKQCLKSQSKSYMVSEPLPSSYESSIEFEGVQQLYDVGSSDSITVKLSGVDYYAEQKIIVWDNNNKIGEYTTDTDGEVTVPLSNITEGKHTLLARFNGTDHLSSAEATIDYSGGAYPLMVSYPSYYINHETFSVTMQLMDYCGLPVVDETLIFWAWYDAGYPIELGSGVTDTDGIVSFEIDWDTRHYQPQYDSWGYPTKFRGEFNSKYTETITINKYENVTIALNQPSLTATNQTLTLTGQVSNVSEAVTVSLDNNIGTVITDTNGNFTAIYNGTGAGDVTVTASISNQSSSVTFEDVLQYWKANGTSYNVNYRNPYGSCTQLTNGWRCMDDIYDKVLIYFAPQIIANQHDFQLEYKIISTSKSTVNIASGFHLDGYIQVTNLKSGDRVKLVSVNSIATLYVNDVSKGTFNSYSACMEFVNDNIQITVDEVKLKRLS